MNITINFTGAMASASVPLASPSYTMGVSAAKDLDTSTTGNQACVYNFGGINNPFRSTGVTAAPTTTGDIWTCEAVLGTGTWTQTWTPTPPEDEVGRDYLITGSWGAWTMFIRDASSTPPTFAAIIALTLRDPLTAGNCHLGWVDPLYLTGVEVFQDP